MYVGGAVARAYMINSADELADVYSKFVYAAVAQLGAVVLLSYYDCHAAISAVRYI